MYTVAKTKDCSIGIELLAFPWHVQEILSERSNFLSLRKLAEPARWNAVHPVERASNLPADRCRGVGITTEVGGTQDGLFERVGAEEGPERGFQCGDDVAGAVVVILAGVQEGVIGDALHAGG